MRSFILGTDWWTDCDDVVALRLLARAHMGGKIRLLGVVMNACMPFSVPSLDVFLQKEGILNLPIGLDADATDFAGVNKSYQEHLAAIGDGRSNEQAENAVTLYRRLLAESEEPVDIVEIGFLQAVAALLKSEPDDISPLNGRDLVAQKVSRFWVMAGKWDVESGMEHNFRNNERSRKGADEFCRLCPVPVTFLGFEVGEDVITGKYLAEDDPLRQVMTDHGSAHGRSSWDPMTVNLALCGSAYDAGFAEIHGYASVDSESGACSFKKDPEGPHSYVVRMYSKDYYAHVIEEQIK